MVIDMLVNRKELCYYLFFVLMLAAKGMGLDSGDKLYYVLSLSALFFLAGKMCLTKYNKKEILAIGLLGLIAFLAYINSGRLGILLSVLAIIGIKDINLKKLLRLGLVVFGTAFAATILAAMFGLTPNAFVVHEKSGLGEVIRWGMGFSTANVLHESYFILAALITYNTGEKYGMKQAVYLMLGNLLVFLFSLSYTGVFLTGFYLILNFYVIKRKSMSRVEALLEQLLLPFCLAFSFIAPFFAEKGLGNKINLLLQARPAFSYYYLTNQPITLFGTRMKDIPYFWVVMDNGYVYFLMTFGIVAFALFCFGYAGMIADYSGMIKKKGEKAEIRKSELAMIDSFLLYGVMEQFISNAFMNLSLFFLGAFLFQRLAGGKAFRLQESGVCARAVTWGEKTVINLEPLERKLIRWRGRIENERKKIVCIGALGGVAFIIGYALFSDKAEYVTVPITSVNYVDAKSILFQAKENYPDKTGLRKEIKKYRDIVSSEEFLEEVIDKLGVDNLTPQMIRDIQEFTLPQYVHESRVYDTFRLRLLESYHDIPPKTYEAILREILVLLNEYENTVKVKGEIYTERIEKSHGTDRIEHIEEKEKFFVEKNGTIVIIENIRTGIEMCMAGILLGSMAVCCTVLFCSSKKDIA